MSPHPEVECVKDVRAIRSRLKGFATFGILLLSTGVAWLLSSALDLTLEAWWPLIVLGVAAYVLAVAAVLKGPAGEWLLLLACPLFVGGSILWYQNTTGRWTTWAYAWALVLPGSMGLGLLVLGALKGRGDAMKSGVRLMIVGGGLFGLGASVLEGLVHLTAFQGARGVAAVPWAMVLVAAGILVVVLVGFRRAKS